MKQQYDLIKELIIQENPDFVGLESTQFQNNYQSYATLSQMQGVIFGILFELNKAFTCVEPTKWKAFCSIKGRKRHEQKLATIQMVKDKFGIEVSEDVADAIGIGIYFINNIKMEE